MSGISNGLGEQALLADWNISVVLQIWMDATAGMAIGRRRGLGRVKHVDVAFLWVQEIFKKERALLGKKHTKEMLADMFPKAVSATDLIRHLCHVGVEGVEIDDKGGCIDFSERHSRLGGRASVHGGLSIYRERRL